jgi:4-amino-4-deoxy-L-arabinose transferase-like glycosyltransferase
MPASQSSFQPPRPRLFLLCAITFVLALALRLAYLLSTPFPYSPDSAYYIMVAENLYQGRGLVADYVWNYFAGIPAGLPTPSNEYWLPGMSFAIAAVFKLVGSPSLRAAQYASAALGALLCSLTVWIGGLLTRRRDVALLSGILAAVCFPLVARSGQLETYTLSACLVNLSLLALWAARHRSPYLGLAAGAAAGLACLARNDGMLLVAVAAAVALVMLREGHRRRAIICAGSFLVVFLLLLVPWWVRQLMVFGHPSGGNPGRTAFLISYFDLFRVDLSQLNLRDYLASSHLLGAQFRATILLKNLWLVASVFGPAGLLAIMALAARDLRREAFPWLIYLLVALPLPALVFPYHAVAPVAIYDRLLHGFCPIIFILALAVILPLLSPDAAQRIPVGRGFIWLGLLLTFAWMLAGWVRIPEDVRKAQFPRHMLPAPDVLRSLSPPARAVIVDNPWGFYQLTHIPCAVTPTDGPEATLRVAEAIGANYAIVGTETFDRLPPERRPTNHPRFQLVTGYATPAQPVQVYRILPPDAPPDQAASPSRRSISQ